MFINFTIRRRRVARVLGTLALCSAIGIGTSACGNGTSDVAVDKGVLSVAASVSQWGTMAQALGGEYVTVTTAITNAAADPHDYEPTASDIAGIASADVVVTNGAGYDTWATDALRRDDAVTIDVAALNGTTTGDNPHLWFSSDARSAAADAITEAYVNADPAHADAYQQLHTSWQERERQLDADIAALRESAASSTYAATESAADYLVDAIGLTDVTPQGYRQATANEGEASPSDLKTFTDIVDAKTAQLLIVNNQHSSAASEQIAAAAKQSGVPIVDIGEQLPEHHDDVIEWVHELVAQMSDVL